jgi:mono/diheme cytochrome c family protein
MSSKLRILLLLVLLLLFVFVVPVFAGGWAVITIDDLPTGALAGETLTIGFTVRQHGITPMNGLYPTVTASLSGGQRFVVDAEADGAPGHYTATLTFPEEGDWEWSIQAFTMDQPMPPLTVSAAKTVSAEQSGTKIESGPASISPLMILRALVFALALIGLVLALKRQSRLAGALAGLCLVVGIGTFMLDASAPQVEAQGPEASEIGAEASPSQIELGRKLFLAKGCITCHRNNRAEDGYEYLTIGTGAPDLSHYSAHPEVLFIRLKDPVAAKSDTKMPNLGLKETEIEALIAFINSK